MTPTHFSMLTINEIFSVRRVDLCQAGVRVRATTACDLRCSWCDTPYAFREGHKREIDEVMHEVEQHGCPLVEVTGGEPLLQEAVYPLMEACSPAEIGAPRRRPPQHCPCASRRHHDSRREVSRQRRMDATAGRTSRGCVHTTKSSSSSNRADYGFAREVISTRALAGRAAAIHVSPVHGMLDPKTLSEWVLADHLPVRVQLQLHKYIWSPTTRGV
jgi:7-carboxy-7-deazaguanine synthase